MVVIIGRPNVGKSTLFNRLVGGMVSIVEDYPGVTRDRLYKEVEWQNHRFILTDTGGIVSKPQAGSIAAHVLLQAEVAIAEADLILLVVDGRVGLTNEDILAADLLKKAKKRVLVVVNKVDSFRIPPALFEFYPLGFGEPIAISAAQGLNTGDLLDRMVELLPKEGPQEILDSDTVNIAVVGKPNVGKSSLINKLIGETRVIVSEIPGTTRDAIDTVLQHGGRSYTLIDTAGLRRKAKIKDSIERFSVQRTLSAVERCDIALIMIDATEGVTEQDKKIAGFAHETGKASILLVNKWDLIEKDEKTLHRMEKRIRFELGFLHYVPILFISALTGQRISKILELIDFVAEQHSSRIGTSMLNQVVNEALLLHPPPPDRGRQLKIYYATQIKIKPPTIVLFVNEPEFMHFSYLRYLENKIRAAYGFEGTPLRIIVRKRISRENKEQREVR